MPQCFLRPSDTNRTGLPGQSHHFALPLLILVAMTWTNKRFETVSFHRQPDLSRSMVQWAQAWVDCISTTQRVVKRPRGCRMVCWRSERDAPIHMVQQCVCRIILIYSVSGRSVAELDQGSRRRLLLQRHETCISTNEMTRLQTSLNHEFFPALVVPPHLGTTPPCSTLRISPSDGYICGIGHSRPFFLILYLSPDISH